MLVDSGIGFDPKDPASVAKRAEADGYAGVWCPETGHDPFLPLALAAQHTERIQLGTGIAVAFARNPMTMAMVANDVQLYAKGRLLLGLGSQIKPHIEKRFSMPWSHPAPRMREFVQAMRAIWACWNEDAPLDFRGEFYTHRLMTPFFNPGPNPYGPPKVFLAAVGSLMTEVAGEVADGLLVHGFTTERYLREVTLPAFERGLARSGRTRQDVQVSYPAMVVTGQDEQQMAAAASAVRNQIAFYGSTPAYLPVLELHGWGELHRELNRLSKQGKWQEMGQAVDDEVLRTFAVVAEPDKVAGELLRRFGDVIDRMSFYAPYAFSDEGWRRIVAELRAAPGWDPGSA
ncbi:LLM class F420-dependent oxidoreductase [Aciditerrimonas ferrireducens]|uniref:LLM class F420-dependent oxidoreductase n=1 Tax=Aciditerrimonas ferrireducens TaxID=667306 RepID=A0ABV6C215_9ACTN